MTTDRAARRADPPGVRPSDAARALATIGIVLWLTGLGLAIATNSSSGSSALARTVKARLFSPVLVPAWLDVGFDHRLTYGLPDDADHTLAINTPGEGSDALLEYPGPRWGERAARWRRLARAIALGGADGDGSPVAAGVGRGGFALAGRDDVGVVVTRLPLPSRDGGGTVESERAYAARVRRVSGEVQLIKAEARGEVAPLAPPRPTPAPSAAPTESP